MPPVFVIVGLGNPGSRYEATRHNVGFWVVETLAEQAGVSWKKSKFSAEVALCQLNDVDVLLVRPQTFMNLSGQAVAPLLQYYRKSSQDLLVIHDEMDLPLGTIRFKKSGSSGGHNGLESILSLLGTNEFSRLRMGIGKPQMKGEGADFVLAPFRREEKTVMEGAVEKALEGVLCFLASGIDVAMNEFNR